MKANDSTTAYKMPLEQKVLRIATEIYVLFLMTVFVLIIHDKYYDIQEAKLYSYLYSTMALAGVAVIAGMVALGKRMAQPHGAKETQSETGEKPGILAFIKKHFLPADLFGILFLLTAGISTLCSEWVYEAFWGNMGRLQGFFMMCWYGFTYFMVSRFFRPKQWHIDVLLLAGLVVCGWGILDYFFKSPFGWQLAAKKDQAYDFSSTIGNVNILTGLEGIYLLVAGGMWVGSGIRREPADKQWLNILRSAFYFCMSVVAFMALTCGCSDNALLSVGTAVCFIPFLAFASRRGIARYWAMLTGFIGGMLLIGRLTATEGIKTIPKRKWGELLKLSNEHTDLIGKAFLAALIVLVLLVIWNVIAAKRENAGKTAAKPEEGSATTADTAAVQKWKPAGYLRMIWALLGVAALALIVYIVYDANHGGHPELYKNYERLLVFNDDWGTHRGYNWRLLLTHIKTFSPFKKLVGSGPETYGIYTIKYNLYAMIDTYDEVYDSPHNEFLQYLFNTGILGFIGYYGMVVCSLISGFDGGKLLWKPKTESKGTDGADTSLYRLLGPACAYGILAYTIQSVFNISAIMTVPIVILLMSMLSAMQVNTRNAIPIHE